MSGEQEVALFVSDYNGLKVSLPEGNGVADFGIVGGKYSTDDPDEIDFLRGHESNGRMFREVTESEANPDELDYSEEKLLKMVENENREQLRRIAANHDSVNGNASNEAIAESLMELAKQDGEHEGDEE